jgi:hypothetical protein
MQQKLSYLFIALSMITLIGCRSHRISKVSPNFQGVIREHKFNNMPMVDMPSSKGSPLMTTLYIYEPTKTDQIVDGMLGAPTVAKINSRFMDSVRSDKAGAFNLYLKPGKYSVFIKYENGYYIPFYSGKDWVSLIEVKPNEITTMDFDVKGSLSVE